MTDSTAAQGRSSADRPPILPRWVLRAAGFAACFLLVAAAIWLGARILFAVPVVLYATAAALLLAGLLEPLNERLVRWHFPRALAALLCVSALFAVLGAASTFVVRRSIDQLPDVADAAARAFADLEQILTRPPLSVPEDTVESLPDQLVDWLQTSSQGAALPATNAAAQVATGIVLTLVLVFFLLKDGASMWNWARRWVPDGSRGTADRLAHETWQTTTGYARGLVAVAAADALGVGVGLFALGVPLAASLTLIVFLGAFVPIAGTFVAGVLAVAVTAVTTGIWQAVVVIALVVVVQQLEGNVLQPLIMSRAVDLHAVVIILAVTTGALIGGVGGAAIAVPLVAVVYRVITVLRSPAPETAVDGQPSVSSAATDQTVRNQ